MTKTHSLYLFLGIYFAILLGLAPINLLSLDTYYYWEWSRHLALSYYDGSPMIAYFIKLSNMLFGTTLFSLSIIGVVTAALTSGIIYKTARLFLSKEASVVAMLSWLTAPLVTMDILTETTYDTPLTLFWALTLYYTVKFIKTNQTKELYLIGASAGLMMLSKYTSIVLIFALLIFLVSTSYRSVFKSKHFYFAMLIAVLIFSPVLIWNYQHQWQSFIYQLTSHQLSTATNPFYNALRTYLIMFIPSLNFMLLPPLLVGRLNSGDKKELIVKLCWIICITFICFYVYTASKAEIRIFWLAPYLISGSLLFAYCFETLQYRKTAYSIIALYALISICVLVDNTYKHSYTVSKKLTSYNLINDFNTAYPHLPNTILTSGWFEARMLFFLKGHPEVYTLGCDAAENQYAFWSTDVKKKIADKTLKEAVYIDSYDRKSCLKQYFDECQRMPTSAYIQTNKTYTLYAYHCINH